jgi:hypothetical protein
MYEKIKARKILFTNVRNGNIIPQGCEICGKKGEAHHPDYTKPLEVKWLCKKHHWDCHRQEKKILLKEKKIPYIVTIKCVYCNKEIRGTPSQLRTKKYCDNKCYVEMSKKMGWDNWWLK